jgi:hypothetical protein
MTDKKIIGTAYIIKPHTIERISKKFDIPLTDLYDEDQEYLFGRYYVELPGVDFPLIFTYDALYENFDFDTIEAYGGEYFTVEPTTVENYMKRRLEKNQE